MTEEKATININIHGGNNQILPNATHAVQHNNYDNQAPKHTLDVRSSLLLIEISTQFRAIKTSRKQ